VGVLEAEDSSVRKAENIFTHVEQKNGGRRWKSQLVVSAKSTFMVSKQTYLWQGYPEHAAYFRVERYIKAFNLFWGRCHCIPVIMAPDSVVYD